MATFEEARLRELALVPWLDGPVGRAFVGAVGRAQDAELSKLVEAMRMRNPPDAPDDALVYLGRDRMLEQGPAETPAAYRLRIDNAHNIWLWAGSHDGVLSAFEPFFLPLGGAAFISATSTSPPSSSSVQVLNNHEIEWDANTGWFSRGFILIDSTGGPWTTDGTWDDDASLWEEEPEVTGTWDSSASPSELSYIRRTIRRLKADPAYPVTIAVWLADNLEDGYWDSPGFYDDGGVWSEDGGGEPLYWTIGHVWGEEDWCGDGVDTWADGDEELTALDEEERWIDFAS